MILKSESEETQILDSELSPQIFDRVFERECGSPVGNRKGGYFGNLGADRTI